MDKDSFYLGHILTAAEEIENYISGTTFARFMADTMRQSAVIRQIEIIGEAARNLSAEMRKKYPDVDWPAIVGMRNKLIHGYFEVDLDLVWQAAKTDIPSLKKQIKSIIENVGEH